MTRKTLLVVTLATLLLLATASAYAGPHFRKGMWNDPGFKGSGPEFFPAFLGVNLSEEQRTKILEIEKDCTTKVANLEAQIRTKILELRELQLKEASEENAQNIRTKIGEILALKQELFALRKDMIQQVLNVLTPEQLKNVPPFGWGMGRRCF
ncbi:MAG: periplasmic heavy metal sensor [Atribacterota bacterium]